MIAIVRIDQSQANSSHLTIIDQFLHNCNRLQLCLRNCRMSFTFGNKITIKIFIFEAEKTFHFHANCLTVYYTIVFYIDLFYDMLGYI